MKIIENQSLKNLNTFGLDVNARFYTEVESIEQIREVLQSAKFKNTPLLIIGGGSNILFTKDFDGLVIRMLIKGVEEISCDDSSVILRVGAGEIWDDLVKYCVNKNYSGIENLSLIPGSVGASPIQNIGAYGSEVKDVFVKLEGINLTTGEIEFYNKEECKFGYRDSIFKHELRNKFIITSVFLKLTKQLKINIEYEALKKEFGNLDLSEITIKDVSETVSRIRRSKLPDTNVLGNAGSFFKNPEIGEEQFSNLKQQFPDIVGYTSKDGKIKVPAGWIIQKCGWKGKRVGNVGSYEKQALVLVNYGNASGKEVFDLSQTIINDVETKFGIKLEREVNIF